MLFMLVMSVLVIFFSFGFWGRFRKRFGLAGGSKRSQNPLTWVFFELFFSPALFLNAFGGLKGYAFFLIPIFPWGKD